MPNLDKIKLWLDERLPVLLAEHQVPGAAVAVLADDEIIDTAAGVLSTATGVEATADSVFQIGSITKVWTATLVMQLVDEGLVELDAPIRRYLPEFVLGDGEAAAASSASANSGRYRRTGASSSTRPSSTSCITSVAVQTLVIEPTWKTESAVASTPVAVLSTPAAVSMISSSASTATAAPGTWCSASSAGSRSSSQSLILSRFGMARG